MDATPRELLRLSLVYRWRRLALLPSSEPWGDLAALRSTGGDSPGVARAALVGWPNLGQSKDPTLDCAARGWRVSLNLILFPQWWRAAICC